MTREPLLVAFHGGPGTGKSTTAAAVFAELKKRGMSVEFVPEVAKADTWEGNSFRIAHQPSLIGEQMRAYDRLRGQCEVIVSDTSTLTTFLYPSAGLHGVAEQAWLHFVAEDWRSRRTCDILMRPAEGMGYRREGRWQDETEAARLQDRYEELLTNLGIPAWAYRLGGNANVVQGILDCVGVRLASSRHGR